MLSDLASIRVNADLRGTRYIDGTDLAAHFSRMRIKRAAANTQGARIQDVDFKMMLISSMPASWNTMVATLYDSQNSAEMINRLATHAKLQSVSR